MLVSLVLGASSLLAPLADLRVGTAGQTVRVEVLCSRRCNVEPLEETSFLVTWATADFITEVQNKTKFINTIELSTRDYGSELKVDLVEPARSITAKRCGPARLCIDFAFGDDPFAPSPAPFTIASIEEDLSSLMVRIGYNEERPKPTLEPTPEPAPAEVAGTLPPAKKSTCDAARELLAEDAWNLAAYQTVALCDAAGQQQTSSDQLGQLERFAASKKLSDESSALR